MSGKQSYRRNANKDAESGLPWMTSDSVKRFSEDGSLPRDRGSKP